MRIVSLISAATEMLHVLGLWDQVVCVSHECDWPAECHQLPRVTRSRVNSTASSGAIDAEVKQLMSAGESLYEIAVEKMTNLRPDLIVTQSQCDVCAVKYDDVICAVRQTPQLAGSQVIPLNPRSLGEVFDDMQRIGAAAGIADRANDVVAKLQRRVAGIRSITAGIGAANRPRVAIIEWLEPVMLGGNWVPELVEIAGGQCELTRPGTHSRYHEWNEIVRFNPQVIIACPCGFDLPRASIESRSLMERPGWSNITAVRNEQVYAVDGNACFNRPGPRLVESVELLAALLHPAQFKIPVYCEPLYQHLA
jgi:iron complex transport system substrate-binding protein